MTARIRKARQALEDDRVRVESGNLVDAVNQLKSRPGKDIIVYGGATFVSSLIEHGLPVRHRGEQLPAEVARFVISGEL